MRFAIDSVFSALDGMLTLFCDSDLNALCLGSAYAARL